MIQKRDINCALKKQIITLSFTLGTESPALKGCNEKEMGVSHIHPLYWTSPQDLTALLGSDWEGFPASHSIHPCGWFLILGTHTLLHLLSFCLACRGWWGMVKPWTSKEWICVQNLVCILSVSRETYCLYPNPILAKCCSLGNLSWEDRWNSYYILIIVPFAERVEIISFQA